MPETLAGACAPPSATPYDANSSIGRQLRRLVTQLASTVDRRMEPLGLTDAQWRPLLCLLHGSPATASELARRCGLDTGGLTRLVDRLLAKGLCQRERSRTDRRVVEISLTPEGERVAAQLPGMLTQVQHELLHGFSSVEEAQLRAMLARLQDNAMALDQPQKN